MPLCALAYGLLFAATLTPEAWWPGTASRLLILLGSLGAVSCYGLASARRIVRHAAKRHGVEGQIDEVLLGSRCLLWRAEVREVNGAMEWTIGVSDEDAALRFLPIDMPPGVNYAQAWYLAKHPDDKRRMDELGSESLRNGSSGYSQEFRTICKDGSVRWQLETVSIKPLGPRHWSCVGICADITERRRAEEALRESEERSRTLLASLPQRVFFKNRQSEFVSVNAQFARDFGKEPEELIGRTDYDLFPAEFAEKYRTDDLEVMDGRVVRILEEENVVHGDARIVEVVKAPVIDDRGVVIGVLGLFSDITERKRTEQALKAHEAFLRQIVDANPNLIYVKDFDGRFVMVNQATADVYRTAVEDMIGKTDGDFHPDPEQSQRYLADDRRVIETRQDIFRSEDILVDAEGRKRWFQTLKKPLRNPDGTVTRVLGVTVDITRHKVAEIALQRARDDALAATRAKSEFLANMSHEIRTPMNGILGMTSLLNDTALNAEQREFARTIESSANALLSIINDILDFSKIEAGRMTIENVNFSLRDVIEEVAEMLAPSAHRKGLELVVSIPPDFPGRFLGDPGRIRQVMTNLVANAVKFTERGEVHVDARIEQIEPGGDSSDSSTSGGPRIRLEIRDTGIGIPLDRQGAIFESFTQADGSTTRKYGGTGLGLAISRQLVDLMGGEIGVESEYGRGSTFWFELGLPVVPTSESPSQGADLRGIRILAVDDNATNRRILAAQLASWECRAEIVESAAEAMDALRQGVDSGDPFRLVILDMQMPVTDGAQAAAMIQADPRLRDVPLVLLSSTGDRLREEERTARGFAAVLTKPARRATLFSTLVHLIHDRAAPQPVISAPDGPDATAISGLRVLLAEDNEINQRVAVRLLERWGCEVRVAACGTEAVAAFAEESFDVILMDVQMPGMDGFAATGLIREREEVAGNARTPIVAMTARALEGDREACTAAGMDDYVSKPVEPDALLEILRRWTRETSSPACEAQVAPAVVAPPAPSGTARFLFEKLHRNCGNDDEFAAEIVSVFMRGVPRTLDRIAAAMAQGDPVEVDAAAHSLTGTAGTIGADRLREYCQEMERMGRCGDLSGLGPVLESARSEFAELEILLEQYLVPRAA